MTRAAPACAAALGAALLAAPGCGLFDAELPAHGGALPPPVGHARFGVSAVDPADFPLAATGSGWYLDWTDAPTPGVGLAFVPLICAYPDVNPPTAGGLARYARRVAADRAAYPPGTLFVVGNEIGYRPQRDSREPARYASDFGACRDALRAVDASFRFATGPIILSRDPRATAGYVGAQHGLDYLAKVLDAWEGEHGAPLPADFVAATAHVLARGEGGAIDAGAFRAQVRRLRAFLAERGLRDRGVLVTEFGAALGAPSPEEAEAFLEEATRWLLEARDPETGCPWDEGRLVQRFAWFTAHPVGPLRKLRLLGLASFTVDLAGTSLLRRDGRPTALGAAWARLAAEAARAD